MIKENKTHNKYPLKYNQSNHILRYGRFGIKATSFGRLSETQFNALRWSILKKLKLLTNKKRKIRFWTLIIMNLTLTKLNLESRMGKGKGAIYTRASYIRPGMVIFEFDNITEQQMRNILHYISKKISLKILLVKKL
uniref:Ribosomal protein L16 n=1 Tax=Gracilariopsis longissima TaxID=172976 RepID=A0A345UBI3_9FLOR|nr:ribosomal protein L16 [Gracilariopsis longissima]AXI97819.1 ribosomal protein L16 [Gracilariopsis longissima]UAD89920.1 ribosomal protein L16 [Gracilariopsis longissima]